MFERNPPTSIKPAATPGERIDLRTTGQPEVPHAQDEKSGKTFLISSLTKTSLDFSNQIDDDCRFDQESCTEYYPVSHQDSVIHAEQNDKLERHEVSKIEDRVQCQKCSRYRDQAKHFCGCGRMLKGITKEVKKQAEQRISSRFIMYVRGIHDLALKNTQQRSTPLKIRTITKPQKSNRSVRFRAEAHLPNNRGALPQ